MIRKAYLRILTLCATAPLCAGCGSSSSSPVAHANAQPAPTVDTVKVASRKLAITVRLLGELQAYEVVSLYPKVTAFVDSIKVDRGSVVKSGQLMARLVAPELAAQRAEAQSKLQGAEAQRVEAEAKLASDEGTYQRLKTATGAPGVVAGNDLEVSQKAVELNRARVDAARESVQAAKSSLKSVTEIESYLQIRAPFDGVITERNVHPGALVGSSASAPMLKVEKTNRLRLVVPVPEKYVSDLANGAKVNFSVSCLSQPDLHWEDCADRPLGGRQDKNNAGRTGRGQCGGRLASGMFPEVLWPVHRFRGDAICSELGRGTHYGSGVCRAHPRREC